MKQQAFGYVRVSGKGQLSGDGFPRQTQAIEQYAKAHGLEVVELFREEGVSGKTELENRPALQALREALHCGSVKMVLIEKLDRLARDLMIQESIIADMERHGFQIVSVLEPDMCSNEPTRVLLRQMMGAFSQYEKSMIVQKLRGARQRAKVKYGRCEGEKPYGALPGESEIVSRMQTLRKEGLSYQKIAQVLDGENLNPRYGNRWNPIVINRILRANVRASLITEP